MEELIIKNSRWKHFLLLIGCMGFVGTGIWMVVQGKSFGWVAILFFGTGLVVSIWQIVDSRPRLIIDERGVLDRTLGVGRIAWSDIEAAYVRSISGNDFICLELKNPEKYAQKLSNVKRAMAGANRGLGFTDFNINLSGVDARTEEVFELLMKYCQLAEDSRPDNSHNWSVN
ncbi:MAG TPA: STM3941 family protein [Pyrinomonadaceae bacterium]